jgi:hypothetical protein
VLDRRRGGVVLRFGVAASGEQQGERGQDGDAGQAQGQ